MRDLAGMGSLDPSAVVPVFRGLTVARTPLAPARPGPGDSQPPGAGAGGVDRGTGHGRR